LGTGKEGQVKMALSTAGNVEAYQFVQDVWVKVGDVVDYSPNGSKKAFEEKEYDYVFDIDVEDGVILQLPFNVSDNPYSAAVQFIERHELPKNYLDQIAGFIIKNSTGTSIERLSNPDPFTGSTGYSAGAVHSHSLTFMKAANYPGIFKKLIEFNGESKTLNETEMTLLLSSIETCQFSDCVHLLYRLFKWPTGKLFPVIDCLRMAALCIPLESAAVVHLLESVAREDELDSRILTVLFRLTANLFGTEQGIQLSIEHLDLIARLVRHAASLADMQPVLATLSK
jgi:hypothetical protein